MLGAFVSPCQYEWFVRELALAADDLDAAAAAFEQARLGLEDDAPIVARPAETELQARPRRAGDRPRPRGPLLRSIPRARPCTSSRAG